MYSTVKYLLNVDNGKQYIVDFKNKYAFYAFVSPRDLDTVLKRFEDVNGLECHQLPSHLLSDQGVEAPKVIHNYFWVRPFEFMTQIKESDEYDPTMLTAILFYAVSLLFVGDIGLGCLLFILGFIIKKDTGRLLKALSIPFIIGGLIYGSVFYTNIYTSLINVPAINRVIDGIVVLVCGYYTIQTIKEMCTKKPMVEKLLSLKGVCGIVALYTFIIYLIAIYRVHLNISLIPFTIVLVICFVLVMLRTVINKKIQ
jgi:vacuolar-type H+-ATPase subunit I/STV1